MAKASQRAGTHKIPSENTATRLVRLFVLICKPQTTRIGSVIKTTSNTASITPVANQKILKLKQYGSGLMLLRQLHSTGQQEKMLARVAATQNSTMIIASGHMRRMKYADDVTINRRRYRSRIDSLAADTSVK